MIERVYYRVKLNTDQIIYSQYSNAELEAKLNENIIKDPSKTYLVWKGDKFPNDTIATFKAPAGCTIDWGDGNVETFETASTEVNTHTYTDGFEYHLISLSNYTVVDNSAFYGCSGLTSVTIGNSVTSISDNAFRDCSGLTSIIIPDSVTSIGDNAFFGCSGLTSVTIPDSVTGIGYQAFYNCSSLTSVTIPDSVTTISFATFSGCIGLTSVTIGNSVRNIGSSAFENCSGLTSVTIPDSVTFMGDYVFSGCSGLKTIKISVINPPTLGSNAFETSLEKIIVPKSSIDSYKSADGWSDYADKIVYEVDSSDIDLIAPSAALNMKNGEGQYSLIQKVAPSTTTDPNNYATGKEAVSLGRYSITKADRAMTVNYDNKNYGKWSFVANKSNRVGSENGNQDDVQSNAVFGEGNIIEKGIEGFVSGKSNINYEGDRFDISGSGNENYTNNVRMSGWKNKSLKEIKTPITSGGGGGGSTNPDTNPTEPTQPFDYTSGTGYADISGTENKVFAMGGRTRGVAGICYSPFGSTEGFWTKAGYLVEDTTRSTETEKYYKPQGLGAKAFGRATHAKEDFTVAGGEQSVALKKGANAIGYYTTANTEWGTAIGKYNIGKTNSLFEVGNGYAVSDAGRKNAFEVLVDGRAKVQTAPQDNDDVVRKLELDIKYDKTGGTIGGDVIITGDLTVNGTQHINNTENLNVENAMIYSNSDGATLALLGGLGIKTNSTDIYGIVYDPVSDSVKLGLGKSNANGVFTFNENEGQPVAIRDDSSKFTNNNLVKWDSESYKFVDAGKNVDSLVDKLPASDRNKAYVRNADGNDTGLAYAYTDEGNTLALRNASGQIQVSDPLQDKDAVNKSYADNLTARYVSTSILGG